MLLARPDWAIQTAFNADPNDPAAIPSWTDLTQFLLTASALTRGRQYELDEVRAASPSLTFLDPSENLNPGNPSSPYSPNVVPYRQTLWQGMWPNAGTGNLLNAGTQGQVIDPSFEIYGNGSGTPGWVIKVGGINPTITTTNPQQGTKSVTYTVAAGATVQGVAVSLPCIAGRQYTVSGYVRQTSASTQQISVDGSAGTSTTTTGAYVRLTKTFTATQPTHTMQIATTGTAVAGTINIDALQHEPGGSASAFTTSGPVIYGVMRPYIERWPSAWEDDSAGFLGRCDAVGVDAFGVLTQTALDTEYRNAVLAKDPLYYWSLGESQGATTFAEQSGNGGPSLSLLPSPYAGPGTPPVVGATPTGGGIPGDPGGTAVQFTADLVNVPEQGTAIACGLFGTPPLPVGFPATPSTAWNLTMAIWLNTTQTAYPSTAVPSVIQVKNSRPVGNQVQAIWADIIPIGGNAGKTALRVASNTGHLDSGLSPNRVDDGVWHLIVGTVAQDATNTTITLFIDGTQVSTVTAATSTVGLLGASANCVEIGGGWDNSFQGGSFSGYVSRPALWNRILSGAEVTDLWNAGKGYPGEISSARVARYLSYGWLGQIAIDTGQSVMGVSTLASGTSLLQACQDVAASENGNFFVDARGRVVFTSRTRRYLATTAAYVFGENTAGGEIPYEGDIAFDFDPSQVNNDVQVTNQPSGYVARAIDANSQKRYFPRTLPRTINVASSLEANDAANYLLATRKQPVQRINTITLNPATYPTAWPVVLGIELGTRVTVKRRSKAANGGAGLTQSADFFVEQISHDSIDMEAGTWVTSLQLSPVARFQVGILDDATYGLLDSTMVLAY